MCEALGSTPRTVNTESCSCHSVRASLWDRGPSRSKSISFSCLLWSFLVPWETQSRRGTSVSWRTRDASDYPRVTQLSQLMIWD